MPYAIMQKELDPPRVDLMKAAFRMLPNLTALDAQTAANDAFGILLRGLEVEAASALQDALQRVGVETMVVDEAELPINPPTKLVKQVELLPTHMVMYDPLNRSFNLSWQDILLLAAGNVRMPDRKPKSPELPHGSGSGASHSAPDSKSRESDSCRLLLEIVLVGGIARYSVVADEFVFNHLGTRLTRSLPHNFALLVKDLTEYAPHVGLNRGAYQICEGLEPMIVYPSKTAFFEEITWLLWRIGLGTA